MNCSGAGSELPPDLAHVRDAVAAADSGPRLSVAGEVFPSFNSTDTISVDLFLSGCARNPHCSECHNPELWDFKHGRSVDVDAEVERIKKDFADASAVAVMGGEPLHQKKELVPFLAKLKSDVPGKQVWLYTSYELDEIDKSILASVDFVKTGQFVPEKKCRGWLSSSNQRIWKKEGEGASGKFSLYYDPAAATRVAAGGKTKGIGGGTTGGKGASI